jgi:tight adherence protein B
MGGLFSAEFLAMSAAALVLLLGLVLSSTKIKKPGKISIKDRIQVDERQKAIDEMMKGIELEGGLASIKETSNWFERKEKELLRSNTGITLPIYLVIMFASMMAIFSVVYFIMRSTAFALPFAFLGMFVPNMIVKSRVNKNIQHFNEQMIKALRRMASTMRAGQSLKQAIEDVVRARSIPMIIRKEFQTVLTDVEYGDSIEKALYKLYERTGSQDIHNLALAIEVQRQIGGNIADLFDNISQTISNRNLMEKDVKAILAQVNTSTNILSAMPFLVAGMLVMINPSYFDPLMSSFIGRFLVLICLCFIVTGIFIIKKLSKIDI